jgi:hypothetical protein
MECIGEPIHIFRKLLPKLRLLVATTGCRQSIVEQPTWKRTTGSVCAAAIRRRSIRRLRISSIVLSIGELNMT